MRQQPDWNVKDNVGDNNVGKRRERWSSYARSLLCAAGAGIRYIWPTSVWIEPIIGNWYEAYILFQSQRKGVLGIIWHPKDLKHRQYKVPWDIWSQIGGTFHGAQHTVFLFLEERSGPLPGFASHDLPSASTGSKQQLSNCKHFIDRTTPLHIICSFCFIRYVLKNLSSQILALDIEPVRETPGKDYILVFKQHFALGGVWL